MMGNRSGGGEPSLQRNEAPPDKIILNRSSSVSGGTRQRTMKWMTTGALVLALVLPLIPAGGPGR